MMKAEIKKSSQEIIGSYKMDATYREPEFADFVTRREFINRTGVFVSPEYFLHIYENYKKAGVCRKLSRLVKCGFARKTIIKPV